MTRRRVIWTGVAWLASITILTIIETSVQMKVGRSWTVEVAFGLFCGVPTYVAWRSLVLYQLLCQRDSLLAERDDLTERTQIMDEYVEWVQKNHEMQDRDIVSFTCPVCVSISYNPVDAKMGYCGHCHKFTALRGDDHAGTDA